MSKKLIQSYYEFDAANDTLVVHTHVKHEELLIITNVTLNEIVYNFADSSKGATVTWDPTLEKTTIVFDYSAVGAQNTDKLQIFVDQQEQEMSLSETFVDPVSKIRVSNPQNLIDTDFEYGLQPTKWETLELSNNIPSYYISDGDGYIDNVVSVDVVAGSDSVTITTLTPHNLPIGIPLDVQGLSSRSAEGKYLIKFVTEFTITYQAKSIQTITGDISGLYTAIAPGQFFQGAQITYNEGIGITSDGAQESTLQITTPNPHGFESGSNFYLTNTVANKILTLDANTDTSNTAPDGQQYIEPDETLSISLTPDLTQTETKQYIPLWSTKFNGAAVNATTNTINWPDHDLRDNDCLIYIKPSGDTAIGGLFSMQIYYVIVSDVNNIQLALTYNGTAINFSSAGTYNYGRACLGLVYEFVYTNRSTNRYAYHRTRYYGQGQTTGSGWDLGEFYSDFGGYGKGGVSSIRYQKKLFLGKSGAVLSGATYGYMARYVPYFSTGYNSNIQFPETTSEPHFYNFIEDFQSLWDNDSDTNGGAVRGGVFQNQNGTIWSYTNVRSSSTNNYTDGIAFWVPLKLDNEGDTLYIEDHGLQTGDQLTITVNSGDDIKYQYSDSLRTTVPSGTTVNVSRVSDDRLKLNTALQGDLRIYAATGTYTFTGQIANPLANSFYLPDHGLATGQRLSLDTPGIGVLPTAATGPVEVDGINSTLQIYDIVDEYLANNLATTHGITPVPWNAPSASQLGQNYIFAPDNSSAAQSSVRFEISTRFYNRRNNSSLDLAERIPDPSLMSQEFGYQPWADSSVHAYKNATFKGTDIINNGTYDYYLYAFGGNWYDAGGSFISSNYDHIQHFGPRTRWANDPSSVNFESYRFQSFSGGNENWYWALEYRELQRSANNYLPVLMKIRPRYLSDSTFGVDTFGSYSTGANWYYPYTDVESFKGDVFIGFFVRYDDAVAVVDSTVLSIAQGILNAIDANWRKPTLNEIDYFDITTLNSNRFTLGKGQAGVDLTNSGTSPIRFITEPIGGIADGAYTAGVVGSDTLDFNTRFQITPVTYDFDASTVDLGENAIITPESNHFEAGAELVYENGGNADISGLTDYNSYYAIPIDNQYLQLAASYEDAIAGRAITLGTSTGIHHLVGKQISGYVQCPGTVNLIAAADVVTGSNTLFKRFFKVGDKVTFKAGNAPGQYITRRVLAIASDTKMQLDDVIGVDDTAGLTFTTTQLYARPDGFAIHRPFDGGVEIAAGTAPYSQITRQTRKYFRYQSGKGIQTSLAINFNPPTIFETLTSNSLTATGTTRYPHRLSDGMTITVKDAGDNVFNGSFEVTVVDDFTFTYTLATLPTSSIPSGIIKYNLDGYNGASTRSGMFDSQNGFFYEYDGGTLYCVRRSSTTQLSGSIEVEFKSNKIIGKNTNFSGQLNVNDYVVIRGMTYKVVNIAGRNEMYVQPEYRGVSASDIIMTLVEDVKVPQSEWNIDRCDGEGPEGFELDINAIQMCYMDYSWYGAGKIRFGFKDRKGHVKYVHEFIHNNRLDEAYMRSGNLPGKYEVINGRNPSFAPTLFHWGTSVIMDGKFDEDEAYLFTATSKTLAFTGGDTASATTSAESAILRQRLQGNDRFFLQLPFSVNDASKFTTGVSLTASALGEYSGDEVVFTEIDGSTIFVYLDLGRSNNAPNIEVAIGTAITIGGGAAEAEVSLGQDIIPLVSLRLSPSVDSNIPGNLGERDIINRMQLKLNEVGLILTHDCNVVLILNGNLSNVSWGQVGSPSLSQLLQHEFGEVVEGGAEVFSFRAAGGAVDNTGRRGTNASDFPLEAVIDMGNSILGGDGTFPNGPDVLTVGVKIIDTSQVSSSSPFQASGRITWAESQA